MSGGLSDFRGLRLLSLGFLLAVRTLGKPTTSPTCPTAESVDVFWSVVVLCTSVYLMVDFGGCLFCACKLRWFDWLGARLGCLGYAVTAVTLGLAVSGLVLYGRAFTYQIKCVGLVGVMVVICAGTFILGILAWWLLIDSDVGRSRSIGDGVGDEEACCCSRSCRGSACVLFCELDPWPAPLKGRPQAIDAELGFPSSPAVAPSPASASRLARSGSGSGDGRSVFRVLERSGEVLYTGRTRQAVRSWVKRNLDREKRKRIMIEDRPRSKRRLKKASNPSPAQGAVSRTPKTAAEV